MTHFICLSCSSLLFFPTIFCSFFLSSQSHPGLEELQSEEEPARHLAVGELLLQLPERAVHLQTRFQSADSTGETSTKKIARCPTTFGLCAVVSHIARCPYVWSMCSSNTHY